MLACIYFLFINILIVLFHMPVTIFDIINIEMNKKTKAHIALSREDEDTETRQD